MGKVSLKCHTRMEPSCDRRLGVPATRSRLTLWLATLTAAVGLPWRRSVHLFDLLAEIEDPRRAEGKLCRLPQVVLFAILAIAAGANSYRTARQKLAQAMTFLAASIVVGCAVADHHQAQHPHRLRAVRADVGPASYLSRPAPRSLTSAEMDRTTAGNSTATSSGAAHAVGARSESSALSSDLAVAGGSPILGAPFIDYAVSQSQVLARSATSAEADSGGKILIGDGTHGVGAEAISGAKTAGIGASAAASIQFYGVTVTNNTSIVFGTVSAVACCRPIADSQARIAILANGPYVRTEQMQRTSLNPRVNDTTIDFVAVSSLLPITDPSRMAASVGAPRF